MLPEGDGPILLVGAGRMGGAMLEGWLANGLAVEDVVVVDPAPPPEMAELLARSGIVHNPDSGAMKPPRAIVLAVKPQAMSDVLEDIVPIAGPATLIVSVAAGWTIPAYQKRFGSDQPIVRVMPNTPAAIGRGMLVACANAHASETDRRLCQALIEISGETVWIDDEGLMDAVTAVSGSGPAYVFHLAECLEKAAVAAGLPADIAARLARVTVAGAGELLHRSDLPPDQLRRNVTSPGGTTAAALDVLMAEDGLEKLMTAAVDAATRRSRQLAG